MSIWIPGVGVRALNSNSIRRQTKIWGLFSGKRSTESTTARNVLGIMWLSPGLKVQGLVVFSFYFRPIIVHRSLQHYPGTAKVLDEPECI